MRSSAVVAIVDPYSSGSQLARALKARGCDCVMVQSVAQVPRMYQSSYRPEEYDSVITHLGDLDATIGMLRDKKVNLVVPGCEMGVELADQLSDRLGLPTNGTALSQARRNKSLMVDVLRQSGVPTPESVSSGDWERIHAWLRERNEWPVVLKPLRSSGSDGVAICHNEDEVLSRFRVVRETQDVFGSANESVLVQAFVEGTEYAVDTVSLNGQHRVVAIWKYGKNLPADVFTGMESMELFACCGPEHGSLVSCVFQSLDALGVRIGPAHCELIRGSDGPVLLEVGARLNGGNNPLLSRYCGGESQIDLMIDAYLDPDRFLMRSSQPYRLAKSAMRVFLIPRQVGTLTATPDWGPIRSLESFFELGCSAQPGRRLSPIAGSVVLVHEDPQTLHHDRDQIRRMEAEGLFSIEPDPV